MKAIEILNKVDTEFKYAYLDRDACIRSDNVNEAIEEIETLQQELKQGQENYDKLWDLYSELKKENKELEALLNTDIDTANVWTWKKKENK